MSKPGASIRTTTDLTPNHAVSSAMPKKEVIAFEIHRTIEDQEQQPAKSKFRAFHPAKRVATVAGMMRHTTSLVAGRIGWTTEQINKQILGHDDTKDGQSTCDDRLMFLPLPSLQPGVGISSIRRVLVVGPAGFDLAPLRRQLNGQELIDRTTTKPVAMLSAIGHTDKNVSPFLMESTTWSTVTPVILPGYDDPDGLRRKLQSRINTEEHQHLSQRLAKRTVELLWTAFFHAGWNADLLDRAKIQYQENGWFHGLELASAYEALPPLKYPRVHCRVVFPRKVHGPIAIGAGRYRGFGLLAPHTDSRL